MKHVEKKRRNARKTAKPAGATGAKVVPSGTKVDATVRAIVGAPSKAKANGVQARTIVSGLKARVYKNKRAEGALAHEFGTLLATLYRWAAHLLYGYEAFVPFVEQELGIGHTTLYRYLRVAKYATAEQSEWGVEAVLAASRLVDLLRADAALRRRVALENKEPATISDIAEVDFPMPSGGTLRFDADVVDHADVEAVIELLVGEDLSTGDIPLVLRRKNDELKTACASEPALAGVKARYTRKRGKPTLNVEVPRGADVRQVFSALARLLSE